MAAAAAVVARARAGVIVCGESESGDGGLITPGVLERALPGLAACREAADIHSAEGNIIEGINLLPIFFFVRGVMMMWQGYMLKWLATLEQHKTTHDKIAFQMFLIHRVSKLF